MAEVNALIEQYRGDENVDAALLLVPGDFMGGSAIAERSKGKNMVEILNEMKVDLCVIGNHEFDFGDEILEERIKESKFPWLGANVRMEDDQLFPGVYECATVRVGRRTQQHADAGSKNEQRCPSCRSSVNVGFFGVCTPATPSLSYPDKAKFTDTLSSAQRCIRSLKAPHNDLVHTMHMPDLGVVVEEHASEVMGEADIVIGLTHLGTANDRVLLKHVKEIDVVCGGHDHDPISLFEHGTLLFKSGQNAYFLGVVDLHIELPCKVCDQGGDDDDDDDDDEKLDRVHYEWRHVPNRRSDFTESIALLCEKWQSLCSQPEEGLPERGDVLMPSIPVDLDARTTSVRSRESTFGNLVADAMLWRARQLPTSDAVCVDLALINGGFIRADRLHPEGDSLTVGDVLDELPFPKWIVVVRLSGAQLRLGIAQMLKSAPDASGSFPHPSSNVNVTYTTAVSGAKRVRSMTIDGNEVDEHSEYHVAMTVFMARGGDGLTAFAGGVLLDIKQKIRVALAVIEFLRTSPLFDGYVLSGRSRVDE